MTEGGRLSVEQLAVEEKWARGEPVGDAIGSFTAQERYGPIDGMTAAQWEAEAERAFEESVESFNEGHEEAAALLVSYQGLCLREAARLEGGALARFPEAR